MTSRHQLGTHCAKHQSKQDCRFVETEYQHPGKHFLVKVLILLASPVGFRVTDGIFPV
jgi:hypothetical protein